MTEKTEADDKEMILNPRKWYHPGVLPLQQRDTNIPFIKRKDGCLFEGQSSLKVFLVNMFALPAMSDEEFRKIQVMEYKTIDDLVKDWRVD